ncbi:DUF6338 family protein [Paeniglutamicibacter sulfureus]|uniref:Uncharacterized protein n=1 Tax=Paeniglutamicibacter sulfureus TaxID=43666 RepID=A0ABU2BLX4_9MICC|nr:DUF6338 family protein [Paeniglutamicibacter sulfureus]MDR7358949.1 hypothetical protein [Paeniglutamicibacter sulfureus]
MPTEPLAAAIYIFFLMPGIAYLFQSEKHRATRRRSAFRETSAVVVSSAICLLVPLVFLAVATFPFPALRPYFAGFLSRSDVIFYADPVGYFLALIFFLCLATLLGFILGTSRVQTWLRNIGGKPLIDRDRSGWTKTFEAMGPAIVVASLQLKTGTWIQGEVASYNTTPEDTDERSLVLSGSILVRSAAAKKAERVAEGQQMVIQSSEIEHMTVSYLRPPATR